MAEPCSEAPAPAPEGGPPGLGCERWAKAGALKTSATATNTISLERFMWFLLIVWAEGTTGGVACPNKGCGCDFRMRRKHLRMQAPEAVVDMTAQGDLTAKPWRYRLNGKP